jgi:copper homeostasis protein
MAPQRKLEIACFNIESALIAQANGADRIEFCENYSAGGVTPDYDSILELRKKISIPLHVIIRPRAGDFMYTAAEIESMKEQILFCKTNGIDGIVFGALTPAYTINASVCKNLVQLAGSLSLTFHRAIDQCKDIHAQVKLLIELGVHRVLTSAGKKSADEGIPELKLLNQNFGSDIIIMPGGGIRSTNISQIMQTGCHEFHSAAITNGSEQTDALEIKQLRSLL